MCLPLTQSSWPGVVSLQMTIYLYSRCHDHLLCDWYMEPCRLLVFHKSSHSHIFTEIMLIPPTPQKYSFTKCLVQPCQVELTSHKWVDVIVDNCIDHMGHMCSIIAISLGTLGQLE